MKKIREAKRYAKILLSTISIEDIPSVISELSMINDLMSKNKEFKSLLVSPQFTLQEKGEAIGQIGKRLGLSQETIRFITHLSELRATLHLPEIIRIATTLYLEKKRRVKAIIMSPIEIIGEYEARLKSSLERVTGKGIDIEYMVDPSLLGGVLIKVGSMMYDSSIKGQLRLLKDELIKE